MASRALAFVVLLSSLASASRPTVVEGKTRAEWVTLLKSVDHKTRIHAASTLGMYFGPDAAPELLALLSENQAGTRSAAAFALGICRNSSAKVISGLEALLSDEDEVVRIDAAIAISQLECPKGCAARMLPELITGLANPSRTTVIAMWLRRVGPSAGAAVPALAQALSSPDVDARLNVALALACVGEAARVALPRLREIQATDLEPAVRENAGKAVEAIESAGRSTSAWWCR